MGTRRVEAGYSLIELLVALAVLAIVTSQLFLAFSTQKTAYVTNERILDVQEDARLVTDLLVSEARTAGYMVPPLAAVASLDGGSGAADTVCFSDPSVMDDTQVNGARAKFDGATVTSVSGGSVVLNNAAEFDIDSAGAAVDFEEQRGVIISDGTNTHCARMTDVDLAAVSIDFTPAIADPSLFVAASTRVVPAVIYEAPAGTNTLLRNNLVMSAEVEDLQVEFAADTNGDGVVDLADAAEFPIDSLGGASPAAIGTIRLSVVTRTAQDDPEWQGSGLPASANRSAGGPDGFRRRRFVVSVSPRNF